MKPMAIRIKAIFFFLLVAVAAAPRLFPRDRSLFLEDFEFKGRKYSLDAVFSPGQAHLRLRGKAEKTLSLGMKGENILLGTRTGRDNFYIFWLNYRQKTKRLAYYDHRRQRSRLLPLAGFSSFGLPEILETNGTLQALVFLGNDSDNLDIFHYEPTAGVLTPLTRTPFSEKNLVVQETESGLDIETRSLTAKYRYRFERQNRQIQLLEEERFPRPYRPRARASAVMTPEYYNTYIGFGDSITWGQIRGVQRLDLCYLTQMRDAFLPLTYGPSMFINLGVPGDGTLQGAERIDQDLDSGMGFYFHLMLGVNDVIDKDLFDKDSSLENLGHIMDAALDHNLRVIVSTLTPRKDDKALYQWYWDNLHALSSGILALAAEKGTASIDTLNAFMNTDPPAGWQDLLENPETVIVDGEEVKVKGNHPNAAGHSLIASLFADALAKFPPQAPQNVVWLGSSSELKKIASWDTNYESDVSHFKIEFGFQPNELDYSLQTVSSFHIFNLFPFLPRLFFRVQSVDRGNRQSGFSTPGTAAALDAPQPGREK